MASLVPVSNNSSRQLANIVSKLPPPSPTNSNPVVAVKNRKNIAIKSNANVRKERKLKITQINRLNKPMNIKTKKNNTQWGKEVPLLSNLERNNYQLLEPIGNVVEVPIASTKETAPIVKPAENNAVTIANNLIKEIKRNGFSQKHQDYLKKLKESPNNAKAVAVLQRYRNTLSSNNVTRRAIEKWEKGLNNTAAKPVKTVPAKQATISLQLEPVGDKLPLSKRVTRRNYKTNNKRTLVELNKLDKMATDKSTQHEYFLNFYKYLATTLVGSDIEPTLDTYIKQYNKSRYSDKRIPATCLNEERRQFRALVANAIIEFNTYKSGKGAFGSKPGPYPFINAVEDVDTYFYKNHNKIVTDIDLCGYTDFNTWMGYMQEKFEMQFAKKKATPWWKKMFGR